MGMAQVTGENGAKEGGERPQRRSDRVRRPLDQARLDELALAYVARFATSAARLTGYLDRKLAQRGWDEPGESKEAVAALVARLVAAGYVDDAAYAQARSAGLRRRGYGPRRIDEALRHAGLDEQARDAAATSDDEARRAALRLVTRRGFGPFGATGPLDRHVRQKQIAAMLRAGHPLDSARELIDAATAAEARRWAGEDEE